MAVTHGGDIYSAKRSMPDTNFIDFSANINPFGTPEKIKNAVRKSIDTIDIYPDIRCSDFCGAAARYHSVDADFICAGNGAADIIFRLVYAVRPKRAAVCAPTFGEYAQALSDVGCAVVTYTEDSLGENIDGADMVFICNPNNPTGTLTDGASIENIIKKHSDVLFVIDECFLDMTRREKDCSMINKVHLYPNIWVLKSLTKMYALAGLRIGYGICSDTALCARVRSTGQPWSVSSAAQAAGIAAFECENEKSAFLNMLDAEKIYMYGALSELGFEVKKPSANFVFFRARGTYDLKERLLARGILIRSCADYDGLDASFYRVCIRMHSENEMLINAIREVLYG